MTYTKVNLAFEHPERDSFKATLEKYNYQKDKKIKQQHVFKAVANKIIENPEFIKELGL